MLPMIENVSLVTQVRQNCRRIKTRGAARVDWWQILAHGILRGHSPTCPPSVTAKLNSKLFWELKTQLLQHYYGEGVLVTRLIGNLLAQSFILKII